MISSMREKMQNNSLFKYFLWILLIGMVVSYSSLFKTDKKVVAMVNKAAISSRDAQRQFYHLHQQAERIKRYAGSSAQAFLEMQGLAGNLELRAIESLIKDKLLQQESDKSGMSYLHPDYVSDKLYDPAFSLQHLGMHIPYSLYSPTGKLNANRLISHLQRQGIGMTDFEREIENTLKVLLLTKTVNQAVYAPDFLQKKHAQKTESTRTYHVFKLSLEKILQEQFDPSDEEVASYFAKEQENYRVPEKNSGTVWEFSPSSYNMEITEDEIVSHYQKHQDSFDQKTMGQVRNKIRQQLKEQRFEKEFAAVARNAVGQGEESLASFVSSHHGQEKSVSTDNASSYISSQLASLQAVGGYACVVNAGKGYIVHLDARSASFIPELHSIKSQLITDWKQIQAERVLSDSLQNMVEKYHQSHELDMLENYSHVTASQTYTIEGMDAKNWEKIKKAGLPVQVMQRMTHPGFAISHVTNDSGYVVALSLLEAKNDEENTGIHAVGEPLEKRLIMPAFVASLYKNATIKYNNPD